MSKTNIELGRYNLIGQPVTWIEEDWEGQKTERQGVVIGYYMTDGLWLVVMAEEGGAIYQIFPCDGDTVLPDVQQGWGET